MMYQLQSVLISGRNVKALNTWDMTVKVALYLLAFSFGMTSQQHAQYCSASLVSIYLDRHVSPCLSCSQTN
jgi:hypothetical protein